MFAKFRLLAVIVLLAVFMLTRQALSQSTHVSARLAASPTSYQGPCPVTIRFTGTISVNRPCQVQYKFIRSDGALAPIRSLTFAAPGTKPVSNTWTLGGPGFDFTGWQAIQVVYPRHVTSNRANFRVRSGEPALPDLRVTRIYLENGYKRATIENVGDATARSVRVRFFVDGRVSSTFGSVDVAPGRQIRATSTRLELGTHRVRVVADPENLIRESNESNNAMERMLSWGSVEPPLQEDRIPFNPHTAEVRQIGGRWKIVDGNHWLFDFGNAEHEARRALQIIKHYGMNQSCFVGRPDPSFQYLLVSGRAPAGVFPGEDSVSFNPNTIAVRQFNGRWKIVDGNHWLFDFGSNASEARQAYAIIKKYGFTRSCFVGRPGPSFTYLRK
jgi:hypothetical protein